MFDQDPISFPDVSCEKHINLRQFPSINECEDINEYEETLIEPSVRF